MALQLLHPPYHSSFQSSRISHEFAPMKLNLYKPNNPNPNRNPTYPTNPTLQRDRSVCSRLILLVGSNYITSAKEDV